MWCILGLAVAAAGGATAAKSADDTAMAAEGDAAAGGTGKGGKVSKSLMLGHGAGFLAGFHDVSTRM